MPTPPKPLDLADLYDDAPAPAPEPVAAPAPKPLEMADLYDDRAPTPMLEAYNPTGLRQANQDIAETIRRLGPEDGADPADTDARAQRYIDTAMVLNPNRDPAGVQASLQAWEDGDAATMLLGPRVMHVSTRPGTSAESDATYRATERVMRQATMGDALTKAWEGEHAPPMAEADAKAAGIDKPWTQDAADFIGAAVDNAGVSTVASVMGMPGLPFLADTVAHLFGRDIPYTSAAQDTPMADAADVLTGYGEDADVQQVATHPVNTASGLLARTGATEAATWLMENGGTEETDAQAKLLGAFWDDARPMPAFDAAAATFYATPGDDPAEVHALPYHSLPERLKSVPVDTARIVEAAAPGGALDGTPEAEEIREALAAGRTGTSYLDGIVGRMPVGVLARAQPDLLPTAAAIRNAYTVREGLRDWRGDAEADAAMRIFAAGLLKRTQGAEGEDAYVFVPSKFAEATRLMGFAPELFYEVEVPLGVLLAPAMMASLGPYQGVEKTWQQIKALRLPNKAGLESMLASGAFDETFEAMGLDPSNYEPLRDPESTYASRVLTNVTLPEHMGPRFRYTYERAGGDPDSGTAKALGTGGLALDVLLPYEAAVLYPVMGAVKGGLRANAARLAAREIGLDSRATLQTMLGALAPSTVGARDGIEAVSASVAGHVGDDINLGRIDPEAMSPAVRQQLVELSVEAGIGDPEAFVGSILDFVRDRRTMNLDLTTEVMGTGGPATQALRTSLPYQGRRMDLDALVRAGNLSPQDADVMMRVHETLAFRAAEEGAVASPKAWFARHRWEAGGTPAPGAYFSGKGTPKPTESPEFRAWFGQSKVVDEAGAPRVVYHGTAGHFDAFDPARRGEIERGEPFDARSRHGDWFTSSEDVAKSYADEAGDLADSRIVRAHLRMERPLVAEADADGFIPDHADQIIERAKADGHDGVIFREVFDGLGDNEASDVFVVFDPTQIKSATGNRGTFDPADPNILYSTAADGTREGSIGPDVARPRTATLFSGGGLVELALRDRIDPVLAVEANAEIGAHYSAVHGPHVRIADVRDVNLAEAGDIDYLHASPVCKNYTTAQNLAADGDQPLDLATAQATADAIRATKPRLFTLENVPRYADSDAMRLVTDALDEGGYTWDTGTYNAADYGAATFRKRLLLRATREGALPTEPLPTHGPGRPEPYADWYATVADIAETLPPDAVPAWMAARLETAGIDWRNPERPIIVMGGSTNATNVPYAFAGGPAPTIKATPAEAHRIILPGGDVRRVTPRAMARITGIPDDYALPASRITATTIIGNGVPPALTRAVIGPMLDPSAPRGPRQASLFFQRTGGTNRGSIEAGAVSRWVLRLFQTGDVRTAFHESSHLLDFVLGPAWTERAAAALGYTPAQIADAFSGNAVLNREIRERIADAGTRMLRGQLRPGSRLGNVMDDFTDTLGDVWARVRGLPAVATPEFRAFWDATLRPDTRARPVAVALTDERVAREIGIPVVASGDPAIERAQGMVRRQGQANYGGRISRRGAELRASLGLTVGQATVDPVDFLARALAHIATERVRKRYGFGELLALTDRTAVPAARHAAVHAERDAHVRAVLGDLTVERTTDEVVLTPDQQLGMARLIDEVRASPLGDTLPAHIDSSNVPARINVADWNSVQNHLLEIRAGAGAFKEARAQKAARTGGIRLLGLIADRMERWPNWGPTITEMRNKFELSHVLDQYLGPAQKDLITSVMRELGETGNQLRRNVRDASLYLNRGRGWRGWLSVGGPTLPEMLHHVAEGLPPEVVEVSHLPNLAALEDLIDTDDISAVVRRVPEFSELFTGAPVSSTTQMNDEAAALTRLATVGRAMDDLDIHFGEALAAVDMPEHVAADAMGIVLEGLRRRDEAVQGAGLVILAEFAGSDDIAVAAGLNTAARRTILRGVYEDWYTGNWENILTTTARMGNEATGPRFDSGAAATAVLLRLMARRTLGTLSRRMAEAGILASAEDVTRAGLSFQRPYQPGSFSNRAGPISREAQINDVAHYIAVRTGWKGTPTITEAVVDRAGNVVRPRVYHPAPGEMPPSGQPNPAAYADAGRIMAQWGFKEGKGTGWEPMDLPGGGRVLIPALLREPIEEAMQGGTAPGAAYGLKPRSERIGDLTATQAAGTEAVAAARRADLHPVERALDALSTLPAWMWNNTIGAMKTGMTTGLLIPNAPYYVGNAIGGMFQLYQGVGATRALSVMAQPFLPTAQGDVTRRVLARMWKDGMGVGGLDLMAPPSRGFFAQNGTYWSDRSIANAASSSGLNTSLARAELPRSLIADLKANEPGFWKMVRSAPGNWQRFLTDASTATDNYFRISTFVDGLHRGLPANEAAETARHVAFDYGALTDWEKDRVRPVIMFYAYQRNNQNLFWRTLLENPHRITGQLRLTRGLQQEILGDEHDLLVSPFLDDRLMLYFREAAAEGHAANAQAGAAIMSPKLPAASAIGFWLNLFGAIHQLPHEGNATDIRSLASMIDPRIAMPYVLATNTEIFSGADLETYKTIPSWLVEMDRNITGGVMVDNVFQAERAEWPSTSSEAYPNAPRYVARNGRAWWLFRNLIQTPPFGRSTDIITQMQRADVGDWTGLGEGHGIPQAAVNLSRDASGVPPFSLWSDPDPRTADVPDIEAVRVGLTEGEEEAGAAGLRPVVIESRATIISRLQRRRQQELAEEQRRLEATEENRDFQR